MTKQLCKQIGITGGIGSGKSIVSKIFETMGVPVYYADERAKWLTNNDLQLKKEIKELLGRDAYDSQGLYNRKWVANVVFSNPNILAMLNALIHPRVADDTAKWYKKHELLPYVLKEAALTNAAGNGNSLDKVIVVKSPLDLRIKRIKERDKQRTEEEILQIIARQKTEAQFDEIADYTIVNDEKTLVIPQVLAIHETLVKLADF